MNNMLRNFLILVFFGALIVWPVRAAETWESRFFDLFAYQAEDYWLGVPKPVEPATEATSTNESELAAARARVQCAGGKYQVAFLRTQLRAVNEELAPFVVKLNERLWTADKIDLKVYNGELDQIVAAACATSSTADVAVELTAVREKIKKEELANNWRFIKTALDKLEGEARENSGRKIELALAEEKTRQQNNLAQKAIELQKKVEATYIEAVPADKAARISEQFTLELAQAKAAAEEKLQALAAEKYASASSTDASYRLLADWSIIRAKLVDRLAATGENVKMERTEYVAALAAVARIEAQAALDAEIAFIKDGLGANKTADIEDILAEVRATESLDTTFVSSLEAATTASDDALIAKTKEKLEQGLATVDKRAVALKKNLAPAICRSRAGELETIRQGLDQNIAVLDAELNACRDSLSITCIDRLRFYYSNMGLKKEMSRLSGLLAVASSTCAVAGGEKDPAKVANLLSIIRNEIIKVRSKINNRQDARSLAQSSNAYCRSLAPIAGLELNQTRSRYFDVLVNWQEQYAQKDRQCLDSRVNERVDFFRKNASSTETEVDGLKRQCQGSASMTQQSTQFELDNMLLSAMEAKKLVLDIFAQRNVKLYCLAAEDIYAAAISKQAVSVGAAAKECGGDCVTTLLEKKDGLKRIIEAAANFNQKCAALKSSIKPSEALMKELESL